jgi:hypothetical protein
MKKKKINQQMFLNPFLATQLIIFCENSKAFANEKVYSSFLCSFFFLLKYVRHEPNVHFNGKMAKFAFFVGQKKSNKRRINMTSYAEEN